LWLNKTIIDYGIEGFRNLGIEVKHLGIEGFRNS
jgi:hypothetical protein